MFSLVIKLGSPVEIIISLKNADSKYIHNFYYILYIELIKRYIKTVQISSHKNTLLEWQYCFWPYVCRPGSYLFFAKLPNTDILIGRYHNNWFYHSSMGFYLTFSCIGLTPLSHSHTRNSLHRRTLIPVNPVSIYH